MYTVWAEGRRDLVWAAVFGRGGAVHVLSVFGALAWPLAGEPLLRLAPTSENGDVATEVVVGMRGVAAACASHFRLPRTIPRSTPAARKARSAKMAVTSRAPGRLGSETKPSVSMTQ